MEKNLIPFPEFIKKCITKHFEIYGNLILLIIYWFSAELFRTNYVILEKNVTITFKMTMPISNRLPLITDFYFTLTKSILKVRVGYEFDM